MSAPARNASVVPEVLALRAEHALPVERGERALAAWSVTSYELLRGRLRIRHRNEASGERNEAPWAWFAIRTKPVGLGCCA